MATYIQIGSTVTVGSGGAANIEFTSIPATYTDLVVKLSVRTTDALLGPDLVYQFNGDTSTSNYSYRYLSGNGSAASSGAGSTLGVNYAGAIDGSSATSNTFANTELYVPNYASSNQKSSSVDGVLENNGTDARDSLLANLWTNTAAITSIKFYSLNGGNFVQYSTASLYGIKKN